jgi:hypothetical protein
MLRLLTTSALWVVICLLTAAVLICAVRAIFAGYDDNITAGIYGIGLSGVNVVMLIGFRIYDDEAYLKQKKLRVFANLFGTPLLIAELVIIGMTISLFELLYKLIA